MAIFRVALRGDCFGKGHISDGASVLACKVVDFLADVDVGAAAEAAARAAAAGGTADTVNDDVDVAGFVSCSTQRRTCICNVLF